MNKKNQVFLNQKLEELMRCEIISSEQCENAKNYFANHSSNKRTIITIFLALGTLLIALGIITLFAINWDTIPKAIKTIAAFVPIIITSVMMYHYMYKNQDKKWGIYTSIFAPVSILATTSLLSQIFHIQLEVYELFFISLLMFLPIAFIIKNYISLIVYGLGTIIYAFCALEDGGNFLPLLLKIIFLALPLIIYNAYLYKTKKEDRRNIAMWFMNAVLLTLFFTYYEFISGASILIYIYMMFMLSQTLFPKDTEVKSLFSSIIVGFLIISCMSDEILEFAEDLELHLDTYIYTLLAGLFFYLSKAYRNPKAIILFLFVLLVQYSKLSGVTLYIIANILTAIYGIVTIILGSKSSSPKEMKKGIAILLFVILYRFFNSDLSFYQKSVIFLCTGVCFMIGANIMKKRIGGKKDE